MPADLTPDTEATMTTTEPRPPSTLSRDGCLDEIRRLEAEVARLTTERDEARFNLSEKRRILKEICDFLHPDGDGPESPAGCDVQGYVITDITNLRERLSLSQQSDRAMAMRAERAERERDEARQAASVEAKLGDEARAEVARLEAAARSDRRQFARLSEEHQRALAEVERLRAYVDRVQAAAYYLNKHAESGDTDDWFEGHDLDRLNAAIWTTCTGIVSTAADGPDADNIPRRVEELRALALQPMDVALPDEWTAAEWDPCEFSDGHLDVGVDDEHLTVEWEEGRDDHFGTTARRAVVPLAVVRALLARIPVEALEVSDG